MYLDRGSATDSLVAGPTVCDHTVKLQVLSRLCIRHIRT